MLPERIKELRLQREWSQAELARRLNVTRSSVNAWEMGISAPTTQYVVELAGLFHVSSDYLLGISREKQLNLSQFQEEEVQLIYHLIDYFVSHRKEK